MECRHRRNSLSARWGATRRSPSCTPLTEKREGTPRRSGPSPQRAPCVGTATSYASLRAQSCERIGEKYNASSTTAGHQAGEGPGKRRGTNRTGASLRQGEVRYFRAAEGCAYPISRMKQIGTVIRSSASPQAECPLRCLIHRSESRDCLPLRALQVTGYTTSTQPDTDSGPCPTPGGSCPAPRLVKRLRRATVVVNPSSLLILFGAG